MICENIGYNRVCLRWKEEHDASEYRLWRLCDDGSQTHLTTTSTNRHEDTVNESINQRIYRYKLEKMCASGIKTEWTQTSPSDWCESSIPMPYLPAKPEWVELYKKVWQLAWRSIFTSDALAANYGYCDYPDNQTIYVWDTCFCTLFQRYAALQGVHPCMHTLDSFYALKQPSGYIVRCIRSTDGTSRYSIAEPSHESINPPLFAWAEWNYYLLSADHHRLEQVLPKLTRHYEFIEDYLQEERHCYRWTGNGNGWDNINWKQGPNSIHWYVDLFGQQALAAKYITAIASEIGSDAIATAYQAAWDQKRQALDGLYWNDAQSWYCSLTTDQRFTRKTLCGIWPLLAGLVQPAQAERMVHEVLMNPACFLTDAVPLPVLAKDEPGYNPLGEYWLGGVWLNMSYATIRALIENGFKLPGRDLAARTLDGLAAVYHDFTSFPRSLWECYAPESCGPASHKTIAPDKLGGVREEFGGWTGNLVNLMIEVLLGFQVNAPRRTLTWTLHRDDDHGIDGLRFADVETDIRICSGAISIRSTAPYTLRIESSGQVTTHQIGAGETRWQHGAS